MKRLLRITVTLSTLLTIFILMSANIFANELPVHPANDTVPLNANIIVNGEKISAPAPYADEDGVIMVPLRSIAESLGLSVLWNPEGASIEVGGHIRISIDRAEQYMGIYFMGNIEPVPINKNGNTFVPLTFFQFVLNGFRAEIVDGAIVIDTVPFFVYRELDNVVQSTFSLSSSGILTDMVTDNIDVGRVIIDGQRNDIFSFVRLPVGADLTADEITSAQLHMKVADGDAPSYLNLSLITDVWDSAFDLGLHATKIIENEIKTVAVTKNDDGWVSLDITEFVKIWTSGEMRNNGLALFPKSANDNVAFVSGITSNIFVPYVTVSGQVGERFTGKSPFGFTKIPTEGLFHNAWETFGSGNCMAFALRDLNPINMEHLGYTFEELNLAYNTGGEEAFLEVLVQSMKAYVAEHGEALQISGFRRIDGFDAPIEYAEYRIALRASIDEYSAGDFNERNFDWHFWAQIDDGRWSQKFPDNYAEIILGTAYNIDPARYYWHGARQWGLARAHNTYNTMIIYFAVTKDTEEFTRHRGI